MRRKMVLIGAGSSVFAKGLILDLIGRKEEQWHLSLVDIDEKALESIYALGSKMIKQKGADIVLDRSTDRRDVLSGANYVVTTIGVGGRRAWEQDVFIPRKYGLFQSVGDATGPGGVSRTMRMIPPMVEIARDVQKYCSGAFLFNFANPMTQICQAVAQAAGYPVAGLCHGVPNGKRRIAQLMGIPEEELTISAAGLNHMVYIYDMQFEGRDCFPDVINKLTQVSGRRVIGQNNDEVVGPLSEQFMRDYHTVVVSNDRHFAEFHAWCFEEKGYFGKTLGVDAFSFEKTIEEGDKVYEETAKYAHWEGDLPEEVFFREEGEQEQLTGIIDSMLYDKKKIFYINLPNQGAIPAVNDRSVIERDTVVSAKGLCPLACPNYPMPLTGFISVWLGIYDLMNEAALTGNPQLMLDAMCAEGYIRDIKKGRQMVDELIRAQINYLPQFR